MDWFQAEKMILKETVLTVTIQEKEASNG